MESDYASSVRRIYGPWKKGTSTSFVSHRRTNCDNMVVIYSEYNYRYSVFPQAMYLDGHSFKELPDALDKMDQILRADGCILIDDEEEWNKFKVLL